MIALGENEQFMFTVFAIAAVWLAVLVPPYIRSKVEERSRNKSEYEKRE